MTNILCNFCAEIADKKCERCGDRYCSKNCQRLDWNAHRYICFPLPRLLPASLDGYSMLLDEKIPKNIPLSINKRLREAPLQMVRVARADSTRSVAAECGSESDVSSRVSMSVCSANVRRKLSEVQAELPLEKSAAPRPKEVPQVAPKPEAQIIPSVALATEEIRALPVPMNELGPKRGFTEADIVKDFDLRCEKIAVEKRSPSFIPAIQEGPVDASDEIEMRLRRRANIKPLNQSVAIVVDIERFGGRNVEVITIDNSRIEDGRVTCILKKDLPLFEKSDTELNNLMDSSTEKLAFAPREKDFCIIKSADEHWYRAQCTSVNRDDTFSVLLVDYGCDEKVTLSQIHQLDNKFAYPCISAPCHIEGIENAKGKFDVLSELVPTFEKLVFDEVVIDREKGIAVCRYTKAKELRR